jgi:uncharacterized protein (DUF58 family)
MLAPEVLKRIRAIELKARRLVTDAMAGNYLSTFKGRGMQFDEVREYVPGDDVRTIDWNVTARLMVPHVKVLREERELTLMLMVDVSPSQAFGDGGRAKRDVAAEMAAVLALLAIRNRDKVGLIVFSDHVEAYMPPKRGRAHVWGIIQAVMTHSGKGRATDVAGALEFMRKTQKRRTMCFVISDFWAKGYEQVMAAAAARHDMIAVRVRSPREQEPPADAGVIAWRDSETGEQLVVDSGDAAVRAAFRRRMAAKDAALEAFLKRSKVDRIDVDTKAGVTAPLVAFFRARASRRRR